MATFDSAPGYQRYLNFCNKAAISVQDEDANPAIASKTILDDKDAAVPVAEIVNENKMRNSKIWLQFNMLNGRINIIVPITPEDIITSNEVELL